MEDILFYGSIVLGILIVVVATLAFPLSDYLNKMEDEGRCKQCNCLESCFAHKRILGTEYSWLDEFMLITFLKVRSYCVVERQWKRKEMLSYFIVGLILIMALIWSKEPCLTTLLYIVCTGALLLLSVVDWKIQYIPFECNVLIFICGLIRLFADFSNWIEYIIGLFTVSGFLFLIDKVATPLMKKRYAGEAEIDQVLGGGDIKLMAATGLLLGWKLNFLAFAIGCIAGSVIHSVLIKIKKGERQLSFGPYLALGVYITMMYGEQLISWYLNMLGVMPV